MFFFLDFQECFVAIFLYIVQWNMEIKKDIDRLLEKELIYYNLFLEHFEEFYQKKIEIFLI